VIDLLYYTREHYHYLFMIRCDRFKKKKNSIYTYVVKTKTKGSTKNEQLIFWKKKKINNYVQK